jgi:hypothetical protein
LFCGRSLPSGFLFEVVPLFTPAAEFPDQTLRSKPAVAARVGARLAVLKTIPAIADHHLLTLDIGIPFGMVATFHESAPAVPYPLSNKNGVDVQGIEICPRSAIEENFVGEMN